MMVLVNALVVLCGLIVVGNSSFGVDGVSTKGKKGKTSELEQRYDEWDGFLRKHVHPKTGRVDYLGLAKVYDSLKKHVEGYQNIEPTELNPNQKKAMLINFYNAGMMLNILRYARESKIDVASKKFLDLQINEIDVPGGDIWGGDYKFSFAGKQIHLNNIEHDLLRGKGGDGLERFRVEKLDPRIHAAVNCAAISCPRVREKAFREDNIDAMLDENMKEWLATPAQFRKVDEGTLRANSIVHWYYDDFDDFGEKVLKKGGAGDYLAMFVTDKAPHSGWLKKHLQKNFNDRGFLSLKLSSSFNFHYNWRINDQRNKS